MPTRFSCSITAKSPSAAHEEFIADDGLYANLWRVQAGEIGDLPEEFVEQASERVAQQTPDTAGTD